MEMRSGRQSLIVLGVTLLVLGVLAAALPLVTSYAITLILGFSIFVSGIAYGVHAFFNKRWSGFFGCLLISIINIVAGILLLVYPVLGMFTITLLLAAFLVVQGIFKTILGFTLSRDEKKFWVILNGIISFVLGLLIWRMLPDSPWILGFIVSIDLLIAGWSMIFLSSEEKQMDF